jgi:hypothetical protein
LHSAAQSARAAALRAALMLRDVYRGRAQTFLESVFGQVFGHNDS